MSVHLDDLNPEQRDAAAHVDGPLLILAGAGSGKTRVITHRIAHLVSSAGVHPSEILAVTFTNKAAGEMQARVGRLLGRTADRVWISTFHSAGVRILRDHGAPIGIPPNLVIYDDGDQLSLITRLLKESDVDTSLLPPRQVRSRIDYAKSCGLGPEEMTIEPHDLLGDRVRETYRRYQEALRAAGAVDFGDLILETVRLFREHPEVLGHYHRRLSYVMVDEFQDTSPVQYALIRLLAGERGNLAVVGDDDQSIYGWRGADVRNILSFEADFPGAKVVRLEQNYRSTQVILDAAHAIIRRSPVRKEKRLWTARRGGDPVEVHFAEDETEEARRIAARVEALSETHARQEIAIFYRVNAMSRVIEDALRARRIPYQVVRGRSFYDRAEIRNLVAYLRLAVNPDSDADFLRVVNTPRRGIGGKTLERLQRAASRAGTSLWRVVEGGVLPQEIGPAPAGKLLAFGELVRHLGRLAAEGRPAHELVDEALRGSGYVAALEAEGTPEASDRLENLTELLAAAAQRADEGHTLMDFLDEMALTGDADAEFDPERVALMTLHAAKGLEFEVAFLAGVEERTLPHGRAYGEGGWSEDPDAMAEERRLCYVGFTRAKSRLILSSARSRWALGTRQVRSPSRFLEEIPRELLAGGALPVAAGGGWRERRRTPADDWEAPPEDLRPGADEGVVIDYSLDQRPPEEGERAPRPGGRVLHRTFGEGAIREIDGFGRDARLLVHFEGVGTKKVLARYLDIL
jgi:DNA helicase II / ATP-dependent DNA helicase PcrA